MKLPRSPLAWAVVLGLAAITATSIETVASEEQAVVTRFGRADRVLLPGIHLKMPWPIERAVRAPSAQVSRQMTVGYRLIDDVQGLTPPPRMTQWLTGDANVVELQANIRYRVRDARQWLFAASEVSGSDGSASERPEFALRRLGEGALAELCSQTAIDDILSGSRSVLATDARALVQSRADALRLGVEINDFQILKSDPLASVASAFRAVQDAESDHESTIFNVQSLSAQRESDAKNHAAKILEDARTEAHRSITAAGGERDGFASIATEVADFDSPASKRYRLELLNSILDAGSMEIVIPGTPDKPTTIWRSQ